MKSDPVLPISIDEIDEGQFYMEDWTVHYGDLVQDWVENLEDGDTLTVVYPNQEALYILDEWQRTTTFLLTSVKKSGQGWNKRNLSIFHRRRAGELVLVSERSGGSL